MNNIEYIDAYFNQEFSREEKEQFEQKIITDSGLAEDMALYLSTKQVAAMEMREKKDRFREIYAGYKRGTAIPVRRQSLTRQIWPWAAVAAVVAGLIFGWNAWFAQASPERLADKYIKENLETLGVSMGAREDSLQKGLRLYNDGKLAEAQVQFETLVVNDSTYTDAIKYAGIVSLRLKHYDKAIGYFSQLSRDNRLYANPGKFFHALTLLKRDQPGDKKIARLLLQQVVDEDLEWKQVAQKWLKEF